MTESALKFGPEWLRALSQGTSVASPPPSPGLPKFKLAEYRYGREEMLAYFPKDIKMPPDLRQFPGVFKEQVQTPVTLMALTEEEQRIWTRSVNSDAVLRLMGKGSSGTSGVQAPRGGRGGSVDRGRGRGRASYYQRGVSLEDGGDTPAPGFTRQRSYERGNGIVERGAVWDERERRYDKSFPGRDDDTGIPNRKDNSRGSLDWRSLKSRDDRERDGEEDGGGWRVSGGSTRTEKWGRSSWRNDRNEREHGDQSSDWSSNAKGSYRKTNPHHRVWEDDVNCGNDLLPEWSTEDNKDAESVGTFDATGAFMETSKEEEHKLGTKEESDEPHENDISSSQQRSRKKSESNSSAVSSSPASEEDSDPPNLSNHQETRKSSSPPEIVPCTVLEKLDDPNTVFETKEEVVPTLPVTVENTETLLNPVPPTSMSGPSSPTNKKEELNFEHLEKAAESLVDTWTAEEDEKVEVGHISNSSGSQWFYRDPQGIVQGPFTDAEMMEWFRIGYFDMTLLVRHGLEGRFCQLGDMVKQWGRVPFLSSSTSATPPSVTQTSPPNTSVLNGLLGNATLPLNHQPEISTDQEQQLRLLQQQLLHQQLIQQQHFLQQQQQLYIRQQFQVLGGLKQTENFQPLTSQQQQQYFLLQRLLAQQQQQQQHQHHPPGVLPRLPVETNGGLSDPVRQFMASLVPSQPQSLKENNQSLWNLPPRNVGLSDVGPRWTAVPSQPVSVWDLESATHEPSITATRLLPDVLEQEKKFLEEQQKLLNEEELQRKQEEEEERLRRQQQEEEERERERLIHEEMQRREEEERRKREELLAKQREIEERKQKEAEEQRRKEEELRKQQEERRRQAEREKEERRKQEELRKQEEERLKKQQEILRIQEEQQQRLEELRRQEEERRRREAEEEKMKLEYQKKEMQRQLELKKLQEEAIKRLQEKQKAPAWGGQTVKTSENSLSLAEIQRLQEEKERQEKLEFHIHQQLLLQEQQMQQQVAQQAKAVNLTWGKRPTSEDGGVKSLLEIQKEEADKLAQLQKEQNIKKQQINSMSLATAGVWNNASSHLLRMSASSSSPWNVENSVTNSHGGGFWEDAGPMTNGSKTHFGSVNKAQEQRNLLCTNSTAINNSGPSGNKIRSTRARKDEETVMKLFEVHSQNVDEFTQWCNDTLRSLQATIDVPTFVTFLKDVESPYEVYDYVRVYLGESKEAHNFAKQFLEKRSKYRNQARKKEENMWGPAPAITPSLSKPQQLSELDGQKAPGTKKKKKNKMQKVDSAILGFTVHAAMDRINVGDIDHVDD